MNVNTFLRLQAMLYYIINCTSRIPRARFQHQSWTLKTGTCPSTAVQDPGSHTRSWFPCPSQMCTDSLREPAAGCLAQGRNLSSGRALQPSVTPWRRYQISFNITTYSKYQMETKHCWFCIKPQTTYDISLCLNR